MQQSFWPGVVGETREPNQSKLSVATTVLRFLWNLLIPGYDRASVVSVADGRCQTWLPESGDPGFDSISPHDNHDADEGGARLDDIPVEGFSLDFFFFQA